MARSSDVLDLAVGGKKKKSRKKLIVGIAMLGIVPVIGSTLAASITLNSGSNIEFGQGYQGVTACDSAIGISLTSSYSSASNFTVGSVVLSNIDTSCNTLTVKLYDASGNQLGSTLSGTETSGGLTLNPSNVDATQVTKITVESS